MQADQVGLAPVTVDAGWSEAVRKIGSLRFASLAAGARFPPLFAPCFSPSAQNAAASSAASRCISCIVCAGAGGLVLSEAERARYQQLFALADTTKSGALAGAQAVAFFKKSGLDTSVLRSVWEFSDQRRAQALRFEDFALACRLISAVQRGQQLTPAVVNMVKMQEQPLPNFDLAGPAAQGRMGSAQEYAMTPTERTKYAGFFPNYDKNGDGFVEGAEARQLFSQSGLDKAVLKDVWNLSDTDKDGRLSRTEFNIAMHLIYVKRKKGLSLPTTLPPQLLASAQADAGNVAPSARGVNAFQSLQPQPRSASPSSPSLQPQAMPAPSVTASAKMTPVEPKQSMASNPAQRDAENAASSVSALAKTAINMAEEGVEDGDRVQSVLSEITRRLLQEKVSVSARVDAARDDIMNNKKRLAELHTQTLKLSAELEQLRAEEAKLIAEKGDLAGDISQKQQNNAELLTEVQRLTQKLAQLQGRTLDTVEQAANMEKRTAQLNAQADSMEALANLTASVTSSPGGDQLRQLLLQQQQSVNVAESAYSMQEQRKQVAAAELNQAEIRASSASQKLQAAQSSLSSPRGGFSVPALKAPPEAPAPSSPSAGFGGFDKPTSPVFDGGSSGAFNDSFGGEKHSMSIPRGASLASKY
eukprot:scaffold1277_cov253-Pinguiococcus_pyrenoidosus.AAC.60